MDEVHKPARAGDINLRRLKSVVVLRTAAALFLLGLLFFAPAGILAYWQAWLYMATILIPAVVLMIYLFKRDPEILQRRMKMREKELAQKAIITVPFILFVVVFMIPGFDRRFGWSSVPAALVVTADIVTIIGYLFFVRVLLENRYASRTIEVER